MSVLASIVAIMVTLSQRHLLPVCRHREWLPKGLKFPLHLLQSLRVARYVLNVARGPVDRGDTTKRCAKLLRVMTSACGPPVSNMVVYRPEGFENL